MYQSSQCATCQPNMFGAYCQQCPGYTTSGLGPCNSIGGGGQCNDTISGTGLCQCNPGFLGDKCQYSNAVTCNGHGTVSASGVCTCNTGYKGTTCSACTTDYYGYPACTYCKASVTCSGYGTCSTTTGACQCDSNHAGMCAPHTCPLHHIRVASLFCLCFVTHRHQLCRVFRAGSLRFTWLHLLSRFNHMQQPRQLLKHHRCLQLYREPHRYRMQSMCEWYLWRWMRPLPGLR